MASVFTRIIRGEMPARFVWKDEQCVALLSANPLEPGDSLYIRSHRPDGVPVEVKAQAIRSTPANYGTFRVGVAIIEPKESWLRLFVSWIADDNEVDGLNE